MITVMARAEYSGPSEAELRRLYLDERLSAQKIGVICGVTATAVKRWLQRFDIPRRPALGLANRGVAAPTADELQRMVHDQHLCYDQIAAKFGVDRSAVQHWLLKHDIRRPTVWETRRRGQVILLPGAAELQGNYDAGLSLGQIGDQFGVSASTIAKLCTQLGVKVRQGGWQSGRRWACTDGHEVRSSYEQRVDDWLSEHELRHELEPRLPFDRRYRGDYLVGQTFIEVWGVTGSTTYDQRKMTKTRLYGEHGLTLVELPVWTFSKGQVWRKRLSAALL
jgi:transposase